MLVACKKEEKVSLTNYNQFVEAISQQSKFIESSAYYDVTLVMNKLESGYRYDVLLGNVKERLSEVRIVCVDDTNADYYPSLGLYDEAIILDNYTDKEAHIYKGINLSGITAKNQIEVRLLVEFKDSQGQLHQEYMKLSKGMEE